MTKIKNLAKKCRKHFDVINTFFYTIPDSRDTHELWVYVREFNKWNDILISGKYSDSSLSDFLILFLKYKFPKDLKNIKVCFTFKNINNINFHKSDVEFIFDENGNYCRKSI